MPGKYAAMRIKQLLYTGICCLCALGLSACSIQSNTEDLMVPPKLSPKQSAITSALEKGLGTSNFTLKYPISGDNRSAYVFCNLDEESGEEVVVFYQLNNDAQMRMNILDQTPDGGWQSVYDMAGDGDDVYAVHFAPISSKEKNNLVIAWKNRGQTSLNIDIYTYEQELLTNLFSGKGEQIHFMDINGDGYSEMVLLGHASSQDPSLQIVRRAGSKVIARDELLLTGEAIDFLGVRLGTTADGKKALYIDELVRSDSAATDIVTFQNFKMTLLTEESEDGELSQLYLDTMRPAQYLCADYNQDGILDIPTVSALPGYSSGEEDENLYRIDYKNIYRRELRPVYSAVSNEEMGYTFLMPDSWIDTVTVRQINELNEWQFAVYDSATGQTSAVLLKIRVSSHQDFQDKFSTGSYFPLASKGIFEYSASIPHPEHPLSIPQDQVQKLFLLN